MIEAERTRLTFEHEGREYSIELPFGGLTVHQFIEELVEPLLLAAGFQPESVNEALWGMDADV